MNPEKSCIEHYSRGYFDSIEAVFRPRVQITFTDDGTVKFERVEEAEKEEYEEVF